MSAYELVKELEGRNHLEAIIQKNVIRPTIRREMMVYEFYLARLAEVNKTQAKFEASEKFFMCEKTVERIIKRLK